ncbi:hypothetical protein ACU686_12000 [Yinghuangia aomiensis]
MAEENEIGSAEARFRQAMGNLRTSVGWSPRQIAERVTGPGNVRFPKSTVDDWFSGKHVPSDRSAKQFRDFITALEPIASRYNRSYKRLGPVWEQLRCKAYAEQKARQGRGREARGAGPSTSADSSKSSGGGRRCSANQPGLPVTVLDPFELEVHPAITPPGADRGIARTLPTYVPRAHDRWLRDAVATAATGGGVMVTLVGDSSSGKTRALWEALRDLPAGWRVWHPWNRHRTRRC